jgi:amino acid adenylation domain-containing protein/non-ribosomal peptide synthase protein (TIGR01720 family)
MTDLQRRIAALPPDKRALLESRIADLMAARGPQPEERITSRDRTRPTPLSYAQQREWVTARLRSANNISGALRLDGDLDVALLGRFLTEIVQRHEVLRSTVELRDREPIQVVHPVTPVPVPVVDLGHLTPEQQRAEVCRRYDAEVVRPFDPAQPRMLRITILRLAPDAHVALFTMHHAASDAWSLAILVQEVAALYGNHLAGGAGGLPTPAIQFGDFAVWQREFLDDERMAAELDYWRRALDGIPPRLALPTDRPHPARPTFSGAHLGATVPPDVMAELTLFAAREGVSLFIVLLAACSVLLHRYTAQDDLVIGSAISGRNRSETERLIGCFANVLPLRIRLTGTETLREVVRQARDTTSAAYDHQDVPFDRLVEEVAPHRDLTQTPLIQLMLNVATTPNTTLQMPGLRISPEPVDPGPVSVDLTLNAEARGDAVSLWWHYSTELFDADTVARLAEQFQHVLRQVVAAADTRVGQVDLIVPGAPAGGAPTGPPAGVDVGFLELFRRQVALAPHAPAVSYDGAATSYADLNRAANRLAHRLLALGIGRDAPVGILVDRSPRLAVAILGVLKAGGAYIPLDPAYPPDRIAFMLADAGASVLVTERRLAGLAAATETGPIEAVLLDGPDPLAAGDADRDPPRAAEPTAQAYVVYTSGSTGRPKGVMIEHRSLVTFARDVAERLQLGAGDRFLQFASPGFDVLAEELFPIWLAGGAVVLPARPLLGGGTDLVDLVERERLTVLELPTAFWHEWVRELDRTGRDLPASLRLVIVGGERILPERLAMWRRHGVPLMHVYGVTEATCSSTFFRLDPPDQARDWPNLPIGTPLPSAGLRILDGWLRPVPVGGVGELHIGGISLARGYLGRPDLTAQRFIADPDPAASGQRLYRTGDLVRQRADGNLEFLSRADTQIKIRGYRVEPAEIESTLCRHERVDESVVVAYEPAPGDRRLVAYVVPTPGTELSTAGLRRFLERELPSYLVPATFVKLQALPLSANGKVDRDRLPPPGSARPELTEEFVAPQSPLQQRLAAIVASVVGVAEVGVHDNFFEIGGDSILAIQVVARAQEQGIQLTPLDLFENPSVALLAEAATTATAVDVEPDEVTGPVPLAPMQRWFCAAGFAEPHHWNMSALLELRTPYEPTILRTAVDHLLAHHHGLRQRFRLDGEQTRAWIAPPRGETPFEVFDLSGIEEREQTRRLSDLAAGMQASLDPADGPVVRVGLFQLDAPRRHRLAVVAHHLVVDVVSLGILLEDLQTACAQLAAGQPVRLPATTASWSTWVRRLDAYAAAPSVQSQREYWSNLVTAPAGTLPVDTADGPDANTVATARTVSASLDRAETEDLLRTAPAALNCRINDLLLTALGRTLSAWSGAPRHLVDLEAHARDQRYDGVNLARTVGWVSTMHPVALVCEPGSSTAATLRTVKEALRAVPSGGVGWQLLRHGPDPVPDAPVELAFNYVGQVDQVMPVSAAFAPAPEPIGPAESPLGRRPHTIEIHALVNEGTFTVRWRYSERLHARQTMAWLADRYLEELRTLIDCGRHVVEPVFTPSDFPLARMDQSQLDGLLSRLATGRG